jgi:hypothetical protein
MGVALELAAGAFVPNMTNFWKLKQSPGLDAMTGEICVTREFLLALPSLGALEALDVHSGVRGYPTPCYISQTGPKDIFAKIH